MVDTTAQPLAIAAAALMVLACSWVIAWALVRERKWED